MLRAHPYGIARSGYLTPAAPAPGLPAPLPSPPCRSPALRAVPVAKVTPAAPRHDQQTVELEQHKDWKAAPVEPQARRQAALAHHRQSRHSLDEESVVIMTKPGGGPTGQRPVAKAPDSPSLSSLITSCVMSPAYTDEGESAGASSASGSRSSPSPVKSLQVSADGAVCRCMEMMEKVAPEVSPRNSMGIEESPVAAAAPSLYSFCGDDQALSPLANQAYPEVGGQPFLLASFREATPELSPQSSPGLHAAWEALPLSDSSAAVLNESIGASAGSECAWPSRSQPSVRVVAPASASSRESKAFSGVSRMSGNGRNGYNNPPEDWAYVAVKGTRGSLRIFGPPSKDERSRERSRTGVLPQERSPASRRPLGGSPLLPSSSVGHPWPNRDAARQLPSYVSPPFCASPVVAPMSVPLPCRRGPWRDSPRRPATQGFVDDLVLQGGDGRRTPSFSPSPARSPPTTGCPPWLAVSQGVRPYSPKREVMRIQAQPHYNWCAAARIGGA